jgi:hypothetical protein
MIRRIGTKIRERVFLGGDLGWAAAFGEKGLQEKIKKGTKYEFKPIIGAHAGGLECPDE